VRGVARRPSCSCVSWPSGGCVVKWNRPWIATVLTVPRVRGGGCPGDRGQAVLVVVYYRLIRNDMARRGLLDVARDVAAFNLPDQRVGQLFGVNVSEVAATRRGLFSREGRLGFPPGPSLPPERRIRNGSLASRSGPGESSGGGRRESLPQPGKARSSPSQITGGSTTHNSLVTSAARQLRFSASSASKRTTPELLDHLRLKQRS